MTSEYKKVFLCLKLGCILPNDKDPKFKTYWKEYLLSIKPDATDGTVIDDNITFLDSMGRYYNDSCMKGLLDDTGIVNKLYTDFS